MGMSAVGEADVQRRERFTGALGRRWPIGWALLAALTVGIHAQPDEPPDPLVPDRPGLYCGSLTVSQGVFQIETGLAYARSAEEADSETSIATPALFRLGLRDDFELRVNLSGYNRVRLANGAADQIENGVGSAALGAKWQFTQAAEAGVQPSMALLFSVDLPVGSRFARPEKAAASLVWAADFSLPAGFGLASNVGVSAPFDGEADQRFAQLFLAASLSRAVGQRAALFLEIAGSHPDSSEGEPQIVLDGGVTYLVNNDLQLDFSAVKGLTEEAGDWALSAGVSFRFY